MRLYPDWCGRSPSDGHLGCFQSPAIMDKNAPEHPCTDLLAHIFQYLDEVSYKSNYWVLGCVAIWSRYCLFVSLYARGGITTSRVYLFILVVTIGNNPPTFLGSTEPLFWWWWWVGGDCTLFRLLEVCLAKPCGHLPSILCVQACYFCIRRWISQHDTTKLVFLLEAAVGC